MGKRIAGVCYVKVDGTQLEVKGGLECPLNARKREPVVGAARVAGFKETTIVPYVKVTAILATGFPRAALQAGTDMTVTAEFANGDVYTLSGGWLANEAAVKGDDGETELEFNGLDGVWQ
jgi:hypothetical protein